MTVVLEEIGFENEEKLNLKQQNNQMYFQFLESHKRVGGCRAWKGSCWALTKDTDFHL